LFVQRRGRDRWRDRCDPLLKALGHIEILTVEQGLVLDWQQRKQRHDKCLLVDDAACRDLSGSFKIFLNPSDFPRLHFIGVVSA
jgi:hypothetical protein